MNKEIIPASDEAWDDKVLGADEKFVSVVGSDISDKIDEAAGTQLISIRMQKSIIEDLKLISSLNNMGYQTLMKQVMQRFVECEKKQLFRELVSEKISDRLFRGLDESQPDDTPDGKTGGKSHVPRQQRRRVA